MEELELFDTKLHEAVRYSDIDDVRLALKEGHDPNQIGAYQWSALHEATNNGDIDIVRLLLKYGGDPNKCDRLKGSTALHYASSNGYHQILRMLVEKGGTYSVLNKDGLNALDVAMGIECQKLLREQRNDDTTYTTPKEVILENLKQDLQLHTNNRNNQATVGGSIEKESRDDGSRDDGSRDGRSREGSRDEGSKDDGSSLLSWDPDEISIASSTSSRPHSRAWVLPERWQGIRRDQTLGVIQLSFEYNSKRKTFKIRVWNLSGLLMPPAERSQISGVYVKSYLQPDHKKSTKQKTEEIRVVPPTPDPKAPATDSTTGDFFPASFAFKRALEYESVSKQMVAEKVVDLEVCITQRFSRKSYVISYLSIPMHQACRKLVKEKFRLEPRIGVNLPENMRVHSATDLDTVSLHPKKMSVSNPSLYRHDSRASWAVPYTEKRARSESNLEVLVEKSAKKKSSIEITVPDEEEEDLENALTQIAVMERKEKLQEMSLEMEEFRRIPGVIGNDEDGSVNVAEVLVHLPQESMFFRRTNPQDSDVSVQSVQSSRPETPSWDYHYDTPSFSLIPINIEEDLPPLPDGSHPGYDPMQPVLPVASDFKLPTKGSSLQQKSEIALGGEGEDFEAIDKEEEAQKYEIDRKVEMQKFEIDRKEEMQKYEIDRKVEMQKYAMEREDEVVDLEKLEQVEEQELKNLEKVAGEIKIKRKSRKSHKSELGKNLGQKDQAPKQEEVLEMVTLTDTPKTMASNTNVETVLAEVHVHKSTKNRSFRKETVAPKETRKDPDSSIQTKAKKTNTEGVDEDWNRSNQKSNNQQPTTKATTRNVHVDEEMGMTEQFELKSMNPRQKSAKYKDEESSIGGPLLQRETREKVKVVEEREEPLDLPVLHRKKRARPKPLT